MFQFFTNILINFYFKDSFKIFINNEELDNIIIFKRIRMFFKKTNAKLRNVFLLKKKNKKEKPSN